MKTRLLLFLLLAVTLLPAQKPELRFPLNNPKGYTSLAFSADGKHVLSATMYDLRLWDVASGKMLRAVHSDAEVILRDAKLAPDGRSALVSAMIVSEDFRDAELYWDGVSERVADLNSVRSFGFSATGRLWYFKHNAGEPGVGPAMLTQPLQNFKHASDGLAAWDRQASNARMYVESMDDQTIYPAPNHDFKVLMVDNQDGISRLRWMDLESGKTLAIPDVRGSVSAVYWVKNNAAALIHIQIENGANPVQILQLLNYATGKWGETVAEIEAGQIDQLITSAKGDRAFVLVDSARQYILDFNKQPVSQALKKPLDLGLVKSYDYWNGFNNLFRFTPEGELLGLIQRSETQLEVWDVLKNTQLWTDNFAITGNTREESGRAAFSPDGQYVLLGKENGQLQLRDSQKGDVVREFATGRLRQIKALSFSDNYTLQLQAPDSSAWQFDLETANFNTPAPEIFTDTDDEGITWSRDSIWRGYWANDPEVPSPMGLFLTNNKTGQEVSIPPISETSMTSAVAFSPDNSLVFIGTKDEQIRLARTADGTILHTLKGHHSDIAAMAISPDNKYGVSIANDQLEIKLWDIQNGEELASLFFFGQQDYAVTMPKGFFFASPGAISHLYYVIDQEIIELEQVKERYFEPGLLAKILGYTPGGLRPVDELDHLELHPKIRSASIEKDRLRVQLEDREGGIGNVVLLLNDNIQLDANINPGFKPAFELDLKPYARYFTPDTINQLSLRAYNREGWLKGQAYRLNYRPSEVIKDRGTSTISSLRDVRDVKLDSINLYALVVGTSKYSGEHLRLNYPDKDAKAFAEALRLCGEPLFGKNIEIKLLNTNADPWPRKAEIRQALQAFAAKADPNDILLVYLSGHGITYPPNSEKGQFYYLTTDIASDDLSDPAVRNSKAIAQDSLQAWINQVTARKRILILDACNSGQVVKAMAPGAKALNSDQRRALERMKDRSGMFVLAGSAADKSSFEASRFGHGLLTYSLLNNMPQVAAANKSYIDVGLLFGNTLEEVPRLAADIGRKQNPELIGAGDFTIGIIKGATPYPIPQTIPVFLRTTFTNKKARDVAHLSKAVNSYLESLATEKEAVLAFWDIAEFEGQHYYLGGQYTLDGDIIQGDVWLYRKDAELAQFPFSGSLEKLEKLASGIVDQVFDFLNNQKK